MQSQIAVEPIHLTELIDLSLTISHTGLAALK
jgi:hypothetical protein